MSLREDWEQLDEEDFLVKYGPYASFTVLLIVVSAALFVPGASITWQLVVLVLALVAVPYLPLVRRFSPESADDSLLNQIYEAEETVESHDEDLHSDIEERVSNLESELFERLKEDTTVSVVRLRIEIEDALTEYARERGMRTEDEFVQFHDVLRFLKDNPDAIDQSLYDDAVRIQSVSTRAVRNEVSQSSATRIIRVGTRLLERLYAESDMPVNPDISEPAFPTSGSGRVA